MEGAWISLQVRDLSTNELLFEKRVGMFFFCFLFGTVCTACCLRMHLVRENKKYRMLTIVWVLPAYYCTQNWVIVIFVLCTVRASTISSQGELSLAEQSSRDNKLFSFIERVRLRHHPRDLHYTSVPVHQWNLEHQRWKQCLIHMDMYVHVEPVSVRSNLQPATTIVFISHKQWHTYIEACSRTTTSLLGLKNRHGHGLLLDVDG